MSPGALALLVSAVCAAVAGAGSASASAGSAGEDVAAASSIPLPLELVENALPPPPVTVLIKTSYYGTITVNHEAHLKRKAHCRDCHGPGPITPITFTPKIAHDRCRGCHQEAKKGPTDCKGCHVMPPKDLPTVTAEAEAADGAGAPDAAGSSSAFATPPSPPAIPAAMAVASAEEKEATAFFRSIQAGLAAGTGVGLSVRLATRQGGVGLSYGIDRLSGNGPTRTALLVGVGSRLPVRLPAALGLYAEGVGGLDVVANPAVDVMAAVGARASLEWTPGWSRRIPFSFSVTGLLDAFHDGFLSPACLYASLVVGTPIERR